MRSYTRPVLPSSTVVQTAVLEIIGGAEEPLPTFSIQRQAAKKLNIEVRSNGQCALDGKVRYALNKLETEGLIVRRVHRGYGGQKSLWSSAAVAAADDRRREENRAAEARQKAADQELIDGFAKLGYQIGITNGHTLTMTRQVAGTILSALDGFAD